MWKLITNLFLGKQTGGTPIGLLAKEIREAIKGKEVDPNEALRMIHELNEAEAKHRSLWVAGWRPFIGWICGVAFGTHFVIIPIISSFYPDVISPVFDMDQLTTVLLGMLGLGGLRTYEKMKGNA